MVVEDTERASVARAFGRVEVMGVPFADLVEAEAVDHVMSSLDAGRGGVVVTPNVDILRRVERDPELADLVAAADLVLADGMPVVWASRLRGTPLRARVAFSEMIHPLATAAASRDRRIVLLGGAPGVANAAATSLRRRVPGLRIVATYAPLPGFERDEQEMKALVGVLERARPDIVVCAFGCPKQERLMADLSPLFPSTWFVGAGGTLTIVAGRTRSAPTWMRRSGLEWAHRLRLEPRRLSRRYLVDDAPFAMRMLLSSALRRFSWS